MSPCNCCDQPPGATPIIEWESRSVNKSKCGFSEYSDVSSPPKRYLRKSIAVNRNDSDTDSGSWGSYSNIQSFVENEEQVYDPLTCALTCENASGSSGRDTINIIIDGYVTTTEEFHCISSVIGVTPTLLGGVCNVLWAGATNGSFVCVTEDEINYPCPDDVTYPSESVGFCGGINSSNNDPITLTATTLTQSGSGSASGITYDYSRVETLSQEHTTDMLLTNARAGYVDWDDDWNDTEGSYRNLNETEINYSERESKWRIKHEPSGTCFLKVWLIERFTPLVGDVVDTPINPYVWMGSGKPCFDDPTKPPTHDDNVIRGPEQGLSVPEENGTKTIIVEKWSCVTDYEGPPNGYPI